MTTQPSDKPKQAAVPRLDELYSALASAAVPNWDGQGALPISSEVTRNSTFLFALANALYNVEASIEPTTNGTVSLQWENEKWTGAVEIGKTRVSAYGTDGEETLFVDAYFKQADQPAPPADPSGEIPGPVKQLIAYWLRRADEIEPQATINSYPAGRRDRLMICARELAELYTGSVVEPDTHNAEGEDDD